METVLFTFKADVNEAGGFVADSEIRGDEQKLVQCIADTMATNEGVAMLILQSALTYFKDQKIPVQIGDIVGGIDPTGPFSMGPGH